MSSRKAHGAQSVVDIHTKTVTFEDYSDARKKHKRVTKTSTVGFTARPTAAMKVKIGIQVQANQTAEIVATADGVPVEVVPQKFPLTAGERYIAKEMADAFGGSKEEWLGFTTTYIPDYQGSFESEIKLKPVESIPSYGFQVLTVVFAKYGDDLTQKHYMVGTSVIPGPDARAIHIRLGERKKGLGRKNG